MLRVSCALTAAFGLWAIGPASAQDPGKDVWVGQHIYYDNGMDYSNSVRDTIELRLSEIAGRFDVDPALKSFLKAHAVQIDQSIATSAAGRTQHFSDNPDATLLVASGSGVGDALDLESGVYLGPGNPEFAVETARAKLLAVAKYPKADIYLRLLLHYALIKQAVEQHMDFKTVINPLRETALELVHQADSTQSNVLQTIQSELIGLRP